MNSLKKTLMLFSLLCLSVFCHSQDCNSYENNIVFDIPDMTGKVGDTIFVPVKVKGFDSFEIILVVIEYDTLLLEHLSRSEFNFGPLPSVSASSFFPISNTVRFIWSSATMGGESLVDDTNLFEIPFILKGNTGDITTVKILEDESDFVTNKDNFRPFCFGQGNIVVNEKPIEDEALVIFDNDILISSENGGTILKSPDGNCWKIKVNNFGELKSLRVSCPDQ